MENPVTRRYGAISEDYLHFFKSKRSQRRSAAQMNLTKEKLGLVGLLFIFKLERTDEIRTFFNENLQLLLSEFFIRNTEPESRDMATAAEEAIASRGRAVLCIRACQRPQRGTFPRSRRFSRQ
jgi:hypothetical protein